MQTDHQFYEIHTFTDGFYNASKSLSTRAASIISKSWPESHAGLPLSRNRNQISKRWNYFVYLLFYWYLIFNCLIVCLMICDQFHLADSFLSLLCWVKSPISWRYQFTNGDRLPGDPKSTGPAARVIRERPRAMREMGTWKVKLQLYSHHSSPLPLFAALLKEKPRNPMQCNKMAQTCKYGHEFLLRY